MENKSAIETYEDQRQRTAGLPEKYLKIPAHVRNFAGYCYRMKTLS